MDILFLIKSQHSALNELAAALGDAAANTKRPASLEKHFANLSEQLSIYLALDGELLYPELGGLFPDAEKVVEQGYAHHKRLGELMAELKAILLGLNAFDDSEELAELATSLCRELAAHLYHQAEHVLPRLRQRMPTQEREDLGQVYEDLQEELSQSSGPATVVREQVGY